MGELTVKEFKEYIIQRDGSHALSVQSALFQYQSANTLSEGKVSIEVLEAVLRDIIGQETDNAKRKVQKDSKTSDTGRKTLLKVNFKRHKKK